MSARRCPRSPPAAVTEPDRGPLKPGEEAAVVDRGALEDCLSQTSKIAAECNTFLRDLLKGRSPQFQDLQRLADQQATLSEFLHMLRPDGTSPEAAPSGSGAVSQKLPESAPLPSAPVGASTTHRSKPLRFPSSLSVLKQWESAPQQRSGTRKSGAKSGTQQRELTMHERCLSVEHYWSGLTPAQRRELLRVPVQEMGAVDARGDFPQRLWEALALLQLSGGATAAYWRCPACDTRVVDATAFQQHLRSFHEDVQYAEEDVPLVCTKCAREVVGAYYRNEEEGFPPVVLCMNCCWEEQVLCDGGGKSGSLQELKGCMQLQLPACTHAGAAELWSDGDEEEESTDDGDRPIGEANAVASNAEQLQAIPEQAREPSRLPATTVVDARTTDDDESAPQQMRPVQQPTTDNNSTALAPHPPGGVGPAKRVGGQRRHRGRRFFHNLQMPVNADGTPMPCPCCAAQQEEPQADPVVSAILERLTELERTGSPLLHSVLIVIMAHAHQIHTRLKQDTSSKGLLMANHESNLPRFDIRELLTPGLWTEDSTAATSSRDWRAVLRAALASLKYEALQMLLIRMLTRHERALVALRRSQLTDVSAALATAFWDDKAAAALTGSSENGQRKNSSYPGGGAQSDGQGVQTNDSIAQDFQSPAIPSLFVPSSTVVNKSSSSAQGDVARMAAVLGCAESLKSLVQSDPRLSKALAAMGAQLSSDTDESSSNVSAGSKSKGKKKIGPKTGMSVVNDATSSIVPSSSQQVSNNDTEEDALRAWNEMYVEPASWWLDHLVGRGYTQPGGSSEPLILQWIYGGVAQAEAEEAADRRRLAAADATSSATGSKNNSESTQRAQDSAVLAAYGQIADAWRHVAAAMDRKRHLRALRDAVAEDHAAVKAYDEEYARGIRNTATGLEAMLGPELCSGLVDYLPPDDDDGDEEEEEELVAGIAAPWHWYQDAGRALLSREDKLWELVDTRASGYASALLCLEASVLELAEEVGSAEAEATQRELSLAMETAAAAHAEVSDAEAALSRAEREGPAPHRRRDALDRAAKEGEHRNLLSALTGRLTSARERAADEEEYCEDLRRRADRASREIDQIQVELEELSERRSALSRACGRAARAGRELQREARLEPSLHPQEALAGAFRSAGPYSAPPGKAVVGAAWALALVVGCTLNGSGLGLYTAEGRKRERRARRHLHRMFGHDDEDDVESGSDDDDSDDSSEYETDDGSDSYSAEEGDSVSSGSYYDGDSDGDSEESVSSSSSYSYDTSIRLGSDDRLRRRAVRRVRRALLELTENAHAWWEDLDRARQRAVELALIDLGSVVENAALSVVRGRLESAADAAREEATRALLSQLEDEEKAQGSGGGNRKSKKGKKVNGSNVSQQQQAVDVVAKTGTSNKQANAASTSSTTASTTATPTKQAERRAKAAAAAAIAKKKEAEEAAYEAALEKRRKELEADARRRAEDEAELVRQAQLASLRETSGGKSLAEEGEGYQQAADVTSQEPAKASLRKKKEAFPPAQVTPPPLAKPPPVGVSTRSQADRGVPNKHQEPLSTHAKNAVQSSSSSSSSSATLARPADQPWLAASDVPYNPVEKKKMMSSIARAPLIVESERSSNVVLPPPPVIRPNDINMPVPSSSAWAIPPPPPPPSEDATMLFPSRAPHLLGTQNPSPPVWETGPPPGYGPRFHAEDDKRQVTTNGSSNLLASQDPLSAPASSSASAWPQGQGDSQSAAANAQLLSALLGATGNVDWLAAHELLGTTVAQNPNGLWSSPALGGGQLGIPPATTTNPFEPRYDTVSRAFSPGTLHTQQQLAPGTMFDQIAAGLFAGNQFGDHAGTFFNQAPAVLPGTTFAQQQPQQQQPFPHPEGFDDWSDLQAQLPSDLGDVLNL